MNRRAPVSKPTRPLYRGGATTYGLEHRAHARAERPARLIAEAVGLGLASLALWLAAVPTVGHLWGHALAAVAPGLGADGVRMVVTETWLGLEVGVPALVMTMGRPGPIQLFAVGLVTAALMLATVFLPDRWRPGVYLARAALLVQASAVLYFAVWPHLFPYTLADYLQGMTATGLSIATATPVVLALALHVQDLPLSKKVGFTALALGYSVVLVPLQYAVQGWLLANGTALWMPVLYLFAGIPLHVFALVALYAWAMSWQGRTPALGVPATAAPQPLPADADHAPLPDVGTPAFGGFDDDPADVEPHPLPDLADVVAATLAASPLAAPVAEKDGFHGDGAVVSVAPTPLGTDSVAPPPRPRWTSLADLASPAPQTTPMTDSTPARALTLALAFLLLGAAPLAAQPSLGVTKTVNASTVDVGTTVTFTIVVTNPTGSARTTVRISDVLPGGLAYASSTVTQGTYASGTGLWTVGTVDASGGTETLTIDATVTTSGSHTNTASIQSADQADPDPSNNIDSATVTGAPPLTPTAGLCYSVADDGGGNGGNDWLLALTRTKSQESAIGSGTGTDNVEAIAHYPDAGYGILYAANANTFGTLDLTSGVYTSRGAFGTGGGAEGEIELNDADGLAFDPLTGILYASHRRGGSPNAEDLLFVVNPLTGAHVPNAFGLGVDYVVIGSATIGQPDIDDLAIDPYDGQLYGVANGSSADQLISIDKTTGAVSDAKLFGPTDVEGLSFGATGELFGTTGATTAFFEIDKSTGVATHLGDFLTGSDHESVACLTDGLNTLSGTVFYDADADGADTSPADAPVVGQTVTLYRDADGSGTVTAGDVAVATADTDGAGDYAFTLAADGDFVVAVPGLLGPGDAYTTPDAYGSAFADFGNDVLDLDFGYSDVADLALAMSVDDPAPEIGDTVTFTIVVTNEGPALSDGATVTGGLTGDLTFVALTPTDGTYSGDIWTLPALAAGETATATVTATVSGPASGTVTTQIATATNPDVDSTPGNGVGTEDDQDAETVTPVLPDLEVSIVASSPTPGVGEDVTFTVTLTNASGDAGATGVTASAPLPTGYVYVSSTPGASYDSSTGTWTVGAVTPGQTLTFEVTGTAPNGNPATFAAEVTAQDQPDTDSTPDDGTGDDHDTVTVGTTTVDLAVSVSIDDATPAPGGTVVFTVEVTNESASDATGVDVTALLPANFTYVSASPDPAYDETTGLWTVGAIAAGATQTLTVTATVGQTAGTMAGEVTAADQTDSDSTPHDGTGDDYDTATATPQVVDITIDMTVSDPTPTAGDVVTFIVTAGNDGPVDATGLQIADYLASQPGLFEVILVTPSIGTFDGEIWDLGALAVGGTETLTIQVRLDADTVAFTNLAEVAAVDQFDSDSTPYNGSTSEDDDAAATATTGGSSSGGEGGLESNGSLAQAIAAVLMERRVETAVLADAGIALDAAPFVAARLGGSGGSLRDMIPTVGPGGAVAVEVSPTDLLPVTNARDIVATDYVRADGRRVGVVFATATEPGEIYEHTKPVCDRLRGATMAGVELVDVGGHPFVMVRLVQADGSVDYAVSFVAYADGTGRVIDSRFLIGEYAPEGDGEVYNLQVWSPSREHTAALAADVLAGLAAQGPLQFRNEWRTRGSVLRTADGTASRTVAGASQPALPTVFVASAEYADGAIRLDVYNGGGARTLRVSGGTLARVEGGDRHSFDRTLDVPPGTPGAPIVTVEIDTGYLFDLAFFVESELSPEPDRLYLADGAWGLAADPTSAGTQIDAFDVAAQSGVGVGQGRRMVERSASASGTVATWATVYRTLRAGGQPLDVSGYRYIEVTASGVGEVGVLLQQRAIASADQYGTLLRLTPEPQVHRIWFDDLRLADGSRGFAGADALALSFTRRSDGTPVPFDLAVSDVRFGGAEGDDAAVPEVAELWAPMPNPFTGATRVRFELPEAQDVRLRVFDVLGREVARVADGAFEAGRHTVTFDARGLASGLYLARLEIDGGAFTRRMTLLR